MEYNGVIYTENLTFNTVFPYATPPIIQAYDSTGELAYYDNKDSYFFINDLSYLIFKLNSALFYCFQKIPVPPTTIYPFFNYDPKTQLITYYADTNYQTSNPLINVYFSYSLMNLIAEGFLTSLFQQGHLNGINEFVFRINIYPTQLSSVTINGIDYQFTTQDFISVPSQITSLIFTSNSLPIVKEYFPINNSKYLLYEPKNEENRLEALNSLPIISIFHPIISKVGDLQSKVLYSNQNLNNSDLINLISDLPIDRIHIKIYFTDCYNNIYPLYLDPGSNVNIRLAFMKK
jgi:hypothetical protein